jgi:hypothetical protein
MSGIGHVIRTVHDELERRTEAAGFRSWENTNWDWGYQALNPSQWSFLRDVMRISMPSRLRTWTHALEECTRSAGGWWADREFIMVCDRPREIHRRRVASGRWLVEYGLHNTQGPAISWRDGTELWAWNGMVLPSSLITGYPTAD